MKLLERAFVLQFLLLFIIPIAFAEMTITLPEKDVYNLGERVAPFISVKEDSNYEGFFSLNILCDNYELQYYTIPLNIESGARTQVTVPELALSGYMSGRCSLKSNFKALDGGIIDSASSDSFFVTDKINVTISGSLESKPGEDVVITGEARKLSNELLSKGEAAITFNNEEAKVEVVSGKFEHTIHLAKDAAAGDISITAAVKDKYGNYGDVTVTFKIISVPTRIENSFDDNILTPGDTLKARIVLYDHTGKVMNGSKINVRIFDPDEKLLAENSIESSNYIEFKTEKIQAPGAYFLLSTFENIKEQSAFEVEPVRKIIMSQEGNLVYIENIGNVDYNDEVTVILESDNKNYLINKKIELKPGETLSVDLSKEVPQGTYDVVLPEEAVSTETESSNETQEAAGQQNVIQNVSIDDNRPILKKTADGLSAVTGAAISTAGYIASRPALATTILILIILGTVTRYSWGLIKSKVKGKKSDDTSQLFKDYKFDEEDNKKL